VSPPQILRAVLRVAECGPAQLPDDAALVPRVTAVAAVLTLQSSPSKVAALTQEDVMTSFRHVLAAVALSEESRETAAHAAAIASACGAHLTLLHATRGPLDAAERIRLRARLFDLLPAFGKNLEPDIELAHGHRARAIVGFAGAHDVDLIVVGTRPQSPASRAFLESLGEQVAETARCSVLAVGHAPTTSHRTVSHILCAVDLNGASQDTLDRAAALAIDTGATLTVLHVIDPWLWTESTPAPPDSVAEACRALEADTKARLASMLARHVGLDARVATVTAFGLATTHIVEEARRRQADMLVLGARSKRVLGVSLLGANAQCALHEAPCPVLLVRPRAAAPEARSTPASDGLLSARGA
jgi:universal stress protein A